MNEKLRKMIEDMAKAIETSFNKLPDTMQAELAVLKEKLNAVLATMKPIDQVPAALDAKYSLDSMQGMMERVFELWQETTSRLTGMAEQMASQATSLNRLTVVDAELASGKLIPEEKHKQLLDAACATAVESALKTERDNQAKMVKRLGEIAKCGLPEAPENVLVLDDEQFDKVRVNAEQRVKLLGERNLTSMNAVDLVREAAWAAEGDWSKIERWTKLSPGGAAAGGSATSASKTRTYAPGSGGAGGGEPRRTMPV